MLRRVAAFCWPLRPVLPLVSFSCSRSAVVGVPGLCCMWRDVLFARQWRPVVGALGLRCLLRGSFDCFCCPHTSVLRPSTTSSLRFRVREAQAPAPPHVVPVLPTPVLSGVPSLAWPTIPFHRAPQPPPAGTLGWAPSVAFLRVRGCNAPPIPSCVPWYPPVLPATPALIPPPPTTTQGLPRARTEWSPGGRNAHFAFCFWVQTKMSWRSLLTSQYSR